MSKKIDPNEPGSHRFSWDRAETIDMKLPRRLHVTLKNNYKHPFMLDLAGLHPSTFEWLIGGGVCTAEGNLRNTMRHAGKTPAQIEEAVGRLRQSWVTGVKPEKDGDDSTFLGEDAFKLRAWNRMVAKELKAAGLGDQTQYVDQARKELQADPDRVAQIEKLWAAEEQRQAAAGIGGSGFKFSFLKPKA